MAIIRGPIPADSFTIISNAWLRDSALSWKAKGLLSYIASHTAGHSLSTDQILAEGTDGKDAVRAGLIELERRGYLRRVKRRGEGGKITGTDYELAEPEQVPVNGKASAGKPVPGADQQEQDVSPGGDQCGFSSPGEPAGKKTTPKNTKKTPSASPRGTRLPKEWAPTIDLRNWFVLTFGVNGEWSADLAALAKHEHEKFTDHWASVPGNRGVKVDWEATWRNWMRKAMEHRGVRPVSGPPASKPFVQQADEYRASREQVRKARMQAISERVQQLESLGLNPGDAYKRAEAEVDAHMAQSEVASSSAVTYIDGVILSEDPKEVTGS